MRCNLNEANENITYQVFTSSRKDKCCTRVLSFKLRGFDPDLAEKIAIMKEFI